MLTYNFSNIGSDSLYEYLYKCIKNDILLGNIRPGEKLPSKRTFAKIWVSASLPSRMPMRSLLRKAICTHAKARILCG